MKKIFNVFVATLALMAVSSCDNSGKGGEGASQAQDSLKTTTMQQFTEIKVGGSMQVFYEQGNSYTVRVDASREAKDKLVMNVNSKVLFISTKDESQGIGDRFPMNDVKIYVTSPAIKEIELAGSGNFTVNGPLNSNRLDLDLKGAGDINIEGKISCNFLDVELTGSGNIMLAELKTEKMETNITGSGDVNYANMTASRAVSKITGSGNIIMTGAATQHITTITGSGKIDASGLKVGS